MAVRRETLAGLLCSLVAIVCYVDTLDCGFCFDDDAAVEKNRDLWPNQSWTNLLWNDFWGINMSDKDSHKSYRPLCVATFRLNYLLHELQPMGYHLVNVLLHGAVCYLYVQLCGVVFSQVWPALIAGLLFAVHPIHTEAVSLNHLNIHYERGLHFCVHPSLPPGCRSGRQGGCSSWHVLYSCSTVLQESSRSYDLVQRFVLDSTVYLHILQPLPFPLPFLLPPSPPSHV